MRPVTPVVLASVPGSQAGTASAVFNTFRQIGGAVGDRRPRQPPGFPPQVSSPEGR
jgi:hypothetical protein